MSRFARKSQKRKEEEIFIRKNVQRNKDHLSIREVKALTEPQRQMIKSFVSGLNIIAVGSAGTGKSFCALYLALRDVLEYKNRDKIIIVRSNVPTRNSGFLPGSLEEKNEIYALPSKQIVNDLCQNGTAWDILTRKQILEFTTTSYVRGLTFDNAVILLEEVQNLDAPELISVLTRLGENSRIIISGDTNQSDLFRSREKSCYDTLMYISDRMQEYLDTVHFYPNDIVRSEFVKTLITILEDQGK